MNSSKLEPFQLSHRLPILPFRNGVLLPGAFVKIRCSLPSSVRLVEQELLKKESQCILGVVPACFRPSSDLACVPLRNTDQEPTAKERIANKAVSFYDPNNLHGFKHSVGGLLEEPLQLHNRGVAARALHIHKEADGFGGKAAYTVVLEGICRFSVEELETRGPYHVAKVKQLDYNLAEMRMVKEDSTVHYLASEFVSVAKKLIISLEKEQRRVDSIRYLLETAPVQRLADLLASAVETSFESRLELLDAVDVKDRLATATRMLKRHLHFLNVLEDGTSEVEEYSKGSSSSVSSPASKMPAEKGKPKAGASQSRAADDDEDEDDVAVLAKKLQSANMPSSVLKQAQRELKRLAKMSPQSPGYGSCRQHLETLADLPWQRSSLEQSEGGLSMQAVRQRLEKKHFGMAKVKQRIVEYIAVRKLRGEDAQGPVLCLVGPPGVGKTSLARSIADALGRRFVRIALGGVRDEADIRGHRRTYVGSLPGRIIEGIKRVGVNNPVMLLDELDKTGMDHSRGDPASALLEVLDPEQNRAFNDHFLGVPFDLSRVVFLATANRLSSLPAPLLDRLEVLELPGYTPQEKQQIATRHIIPKVLEENGIQPRLHLTIPPHVIDLVIQGYTREAGVRSLSRQLSALARAAAVQVAQSQPSAKLTRQVADRTLSEGGGEGAELEMEVGALGVEGAEVAQAMAGLTPLVADEAMVEAVLGPAPYLDSLSEAAQRVRLPGAALGLVWTSAGGELLAVEASSVGGRGQLYLTGQLGDVAKESAQIALTWVRSCALDLLPPSSPSRNILSSERDVHIHLPLGSVPKDGPSAGVTLVACLVSLLTGQSVRYDTAMTGEITLRGLVLPVGGVKEKILAAHRSGIRRVIIPQGNVKDIKEVPSDVLAAMEILPARNIEEVLHEAFQDCPLRRTSKL